MEMPSAVFHADINGKSTIIMISSAKDEKTTEIVIGTLAYRRPNNHSREELFS